MDVQVPLPGLRLAAPFPSPCSCHCWGCCPTQTSVYLALSSSLARGLFSNISHQFLDWLPTN